MMKTLPSGQFGNILVKPRWPANLVLIDENALENLQKAQTMLPCHLKIVLTRGFEPEKIGKKYSRQIGKWIFNTIYPSRKNEANDIFYHNGHATDGKHVDIGIYKNGKLIRFLPYSVFTSVHILKLKRIFYAKELMTVQKALISSGFDIHQNTTEALQIHCDFKS